ncbi:OmpA family protein [Desulfocurvibacter africanus]|uniref:OmpA/MotB domain protein n=2 Tax=Desulfocurvibacter africanus TaxID=873 RepID=F3Z049_DESAF|nr:OmpA family protein [Desulfocurvibacter africanus]EGJ52078.1 OmpA/MotB domain protein [Desulfocurvibacter africanus subsp. africanus str. Walvis Bay]
MKKIAIKILLVCMCSALFAAGCTTDPYTGERQVSRTAIGAGAGAAAGAAGGAIFGGGDRGKRVLIGAGIGALAGGAVGGYMDYQESKLRQRLQGTGVSVTRQGDMIILNMPGNVTFDTGSAGIKPQFFEVLNSVAIVLKEYEKTYVDVLGHTDSTGSMNLNMRLSQDRAQSVAQYLISQGVQQERFLVRGMGPNQPIADNSTAAGRSQNRRVEIKLTPITQQ